MRAAAGACLSVRQHELAVQSVPESGGSSGNVLAPTGDGPVVAPPQSAGDIVRDPGGGVSTAPVPDFHRCKECRERMEHACVDPTCAEGVRWVILCLVCYEQMIDRLGEVGR
jgi:hypothetical protein